jgi:hypothetical protein
MNERVTNVWELINVFNSHHIIDEAVVSADSKTRAEIISYLSKNDDWEEDCYINTSTSQYYCFIRQSDNAYISIHDGEDKFFDDIILTKNSNFAYID